MNVLVVDDDEGVRDSLCEFIESEDHVCETAKNGLEALEILRNYQPELIIADISMPEMTGIELSRHLRTKYMDRTTKIILVSGRQPTKVELKIIAEIGIVEVIKKPINALKIRAHLLSRHPCN